MLEAQKLPVELSVDDDICLFSMSCVIFLSWKLGNLFIDAEDHDFNGFEITY